MAIETDCPSCGRRLQVADEHAGKQARCPVCNTICSVPIENQDAASVIRTWRMKTPEGRTYGPVAKQELDAWVAEGRISADCQLLDDEQGSWCSATSVYPILQPDYSAPRAGRPQQGPSPVRRPVGRPGTATRVEPHRGGLILALGVVSWVSCPLLGLAAWIMGNSDLRRMRARRMDPEGIPLTQAGQILGMVHVILSVLICLFGLFLVLLISLAH